MNVSTIADQVERHLRELAVRIGARPVGWDSNRQAEAYIASILEACRLEVERQSFDCLAWEGHGIEVMLAGEPIAARLNPLSPPCDVTASPVTAGSLAELETLRLKNHIVVLHGALTAEPLWPKNFKFFTVEEHQRIIHLLEAGQPQAVIVVSPKADNPAPIIEDGDFAIPSATVAADVGAQLLAHPGRDIRLCIDATRRAARGANVIGRRRGKQTIVVCAHFDTKHDTPGAVDNAAGVAALLAIAQVLRDRDISAGLEFIAFNGEDYYSAPGQVAYFDHYGADPARIRLAINIDGVGVKDKPNSIAYFECPEPLVHRAEHIRSRRPNLVRVDPWPQGDHMLFAMQAVPALAFTSAEIEAWIDTVMHTPADTIDQLDTVRVAEVVQFVSDLLDQIAAP